MFVAKKKKFDEGNVGKATKLQMDGQFMEI